MLLSEEIKKITDEFNKYISVLTDSTAYFRPLRTDLKAGDVEIGMTRRIIHKKIDEEWIDAIESAIISLDNIIRKPGRFLQVEEEVKPIELSRNITSRSIQHLSQHSDYISEIRADGEIIPSKILNVYNEETLETYENKFVNTLIRQLYIFVTKRYSEMEKKGQENESSLSFKASFDEGNIHAKINFGISLSESADGQAKLDPIFERVKNLNSVITAYYNSPFVREMHGAYVRPPILHTNAIMVNRDLRTCLELWQFIQAYEKVGYSISVEQRSERPDSEVIDRLYSDMAYQYILFREALSEVDAVLEEETPPPFQPLFVKDIKLVEQKTFNIDDCEYRKVYSLPNKDFVFRKKKFTKQQLQIREEAEWALELDSIMEKEARESRAKMVVTPNIAMDEVVAEEPLLPAMPVSEPVSEPETEVVETVEEPVNKSAPEPEAEVVEPVEEPVSEPVSEPEAEVVEPVEEPVNEPVSEPEAEVVEPVEEPVSEPVSEPEAEIVEPVEEPVNEPVSEPETEVEPVNEPTPEPETEVEVVPVAENSVEVIVGENVEEEIELDDEEEMDEGDRRKFRSSLKKNRKKRTRLLKTISNKQNNPHQK